MLPTVPDPLQQTSANMLEFLRLRELVASYASTPPGQEWTLALRPSKNVRWVATEQQRVVEVLRLLLGGYSFDFHGLIDPNDILARARIAGAALEVEELRAISALAGRFRALREWMSVAPDDSNPPFANDAKDGAPDILAHVSKARHGAPGVQSSLRQLAAPLIDSSFAGLLDSIDGKFESDGSLVDHASPELARIRRRMQRQQHAIEEGLRHMLHRLEPGGSLQEDLITVRGERFVLPVKAEWKRRVPGVVHGASSSGQTLFIEPIETIEQNNELQRLLEEEQEEVRRILAAMTQRVAEHADALGTCARVLAEIESLFARARFARDFQCIAPVFSPPGSERISLTAARHPLLEKRLRDEVDLPSSPPFAAQRMGHPQTVEAPLQPSIGRDSKAEMIVPLDLDLPAETPQLIISGPNTGGKTVALKTVGLLALMAQAGIPVPAEVAELPLFDAVLADIGDAQSIAQNLSTFSAHIARLNVVAESATAHSLVLLDELGSATDPEEGAALAAAIAAHFLERRSWCLVSTHHTSLKVYAANTPGVQNAAAGFEEDTFAPTYRIRIGVPGVSAGIHIAQRLGLHAAIVSNARERLGKQAEEIGRFLDRLHADLLAVSAERTALRLEEEKIARARQQLEREGRQEQQRKVQELEGKLASLLKEFEYQIREVLRGIEDRTTQQKAGKQAERTLAKLRREFREQVDATVVAHQTGADRNDPHAQPHVVRVVGVGDTVRLRSLGKNVRVDRQVDTDHFEVSAGMLKMRIRRDDIAEVVLPMAEATRQLSPVASARSKGIRVALAHENSTVRTEINVIGQTVEEATDTLEKFLDQAFLEGLARVRIVHGSGMGVLRKALRAHLAKHPQVLAVSEPAQNQGGSGVTVVELRQ